MRVRPKGISMICSVPFPVVLLAKPSGFSNASGLYAFYSCIVSTAAALFIAVPTNHPQVREVCESCRSQSITRVALSNRELGDEEVKARFRGGRGLLTVSRGRVEEIKNSREALTSTGHQTLNFYFFL